MDSSHFIACGVSVRVGFTVECCGVDRCSRASSGLDLPKFGTMLFETMEYFHGITRDNLWAERQRPQNDDGSISEAAGEGAAVMS